jgi:hypothetical protein
MTFAGINYIAVVIAALAGFGTGTAWYMTLSKAWLAAVGKTKEDLPQSSRPFIITIVALLVMAWMLAGLIGHMGEVTILNGVISGFFVWLGFVITTMAVNHAFGGARPMLTLIDGGHWLAVLLIQGAIIGAFGI